MQESGSKEVKLREDDPLAIVSLLRYIYDLPYQINGSERWPVSLESRAELYVTAEKYLVKGLQSEIRRDMAAEFDSYHMSSILLHVTDFVQAFRTIIGRTSRENDVRELMLKTCVMNLRYLQREEVFLLLLKDFAELGAAIIGYKDLECALLGSWMCSKKCDNEELLVCSDCSKPFAKELAWTSRHKKTWYCGHCELYMVPECKACDSKLIWIQRDIR